MWRLIDLIRGIQGQHYTTKILRVFLGFIPLVLFQLLCTVGFLITIIFDFISYGYKHNAFYSDDRDTLFHPYLLFTSELIGIWYGNEEKQEFECD